MATSLLDIGTVFDVKGLVAVITGGGTGIGLMMAQALEANGAIVYIIGRRKEVLEKATQTAKNGNIHSLVGDVTSKTSLLAAASQIKSLHGHIDLLVANSGISSSGQSLQGLSLDATLADFSQYVLEEWEEEAWATTFAVNVTGVFLTIAAFLELLDAGNVGREREREDGKRQGSQVVVIGSNGAFMRGSVSGFAYNASKAAVTHMTKMLSTRFARWGIRANVIAPGPYPSEMNESLIQNIALNRDNYPERRAGDGQDMGGAILFLASRAGAYLNGSVLMTDGGRVAITPSSY